MEIELAAFWPLKAFPASEFRPKISTWRWDTQREFITANGRKVVYWWSCLFASLQRSFLLFFPAIQIWMSSISGWGIQKYKRIQSYHKDNSHYQDSCSANLSSMKHRRPLFGTRRRGAAATAAAFKKETPTQINRLSSTNVQNKKNKQG